MERRHYDRLIELAAAELLDQRLDSGGLDRLRLRVDPRRPEAEDLVDPGQQFGRGLSTGAAEESHVPRLCGDGAQGRACEQDVAVVVEPDHEDAQIHRAASRTRSTAALSEGATRGADATSSGRVFPFGTRMARAPAERAAWTSAPTSPITTQRAGSTTRPGRGFRQAQPVSGACGQTNQGSSGPRSSSTRRFTAWTCSVERSPRP